MFFLSAAIDTAESAKEKFGAALRVVQDLNKRAPTFCFETQAICLNQTKMDRGNMQYQLYMFDNDIDNMTAYCYNLDKIMTGAVL